VVGWKEWERAVDQLAMQGYNMPLAATGMEGVWYNTLLRFDFTDLEARTFLSAPGHLPWQLMQNLEGSEDPLPKSWIDSHIELGRKIIERERELGMTPIQQGFSGHVPHLLKRNSPKPPLPCNLAGVTSQEWRNSTHWILCLKNSVWPSLKRKLNFSAPTISTPPIPSMKRAAAAR